jgi:thiamine-phosphate pyrophosphorylase
MAVVQSCRAGLSAAAQGATVLQLRSRVAVRELESEAADLVTASALPVLVSARVDVALAVGAAGVNLPERDLPVGEARRLLGPERLVGKSVHSLEAAQRAETDGADYVIFGPVFVTPSHKGAEPVGLGELARIARAVRIPVLAIGGVDWQRAEECALAGAAGFAAISLFATKP